MYKAGDPRKYAGLEMAEGTFMLLKNDPKKFKKCCNGVGSKNGFWGKLTYHLIPNTIWGLNITPVSDIHDVEYTYPRYFNSVEEALAFKHEADMRFFRNGRTLVKMKTKWRWLRKLRLQRLREYRWTLSHFGDESFLSEKIINGEKIEKHPNEQPKYEEE